MDLTDQSDLDVILTDIRSLYDSIAIIDNYNYTHLDSIYFTEGLHFDSLQSKLEQIWSLTYDQQTIKKLRMFDLKSDLTDIDDELDLITPRGIFDEYYITIYKLLIKEITEGNLEPGDYDDLNAIAQDYADSSMANVTAFTYFNLCSDEPYPDYSLKCEAPPRVEEYQVNPANLDLTELKDFRISLNGTTYFTDTPFKGILSLYDLTGRSVYSNYLIVDSSQINLNLDIVPGIYYFRITSVDFQSLYKSGLIPIILK